MLPIQGYTTADLIAYQRQMALAQSAAGALLPLPNQQGLNMGLTGMGLGTRTGYDWLLMEDRRRIFYRLTDLYTQTLQHPLL